MRDLNFFASWNLNEATLRKLSEKLQLTHYFRWRMWIFWWIIALSLNSELQRLLICFQQLLVCCSVFFNHAGHWLLYVATVMASLDPGWHKQRIYLLRRKVLYQLASGNRLGWQCSMSLLLLPILKHQQFFLSLFTLMINLMKTYKISLNIIPLYWNMPTSKLHSLLIIQNNLNLGSLLRTACPKGWG